MKRRVFILLLGTLLLVAPAFATDSPSVLPPNVTAYSSAELSVLLSAVAQLEALPGGSNLGSRRYFASGDWQSRDFARYTAGVLAERGYKTLLASSAGWPDGVHTWVLVGIPLPGRTAWVPVEAAPAAGLSQQILGRVPTSVDAAAKLWFSPNYSAFTNVVGLSANLSPVAVLRGPTLGRAQVGETVSFLGIGSRDPDGQVVLYQWDFGDGETSVSNAAVAYHAFDNAGTYNVSLTVVDSGGKSATATQTVVIGGDMMKDPRPQPPCGCGTKP